MLAIHNTSLVFKIGGTVANAFAKLSKCQQFTTNRLQYYKRQMLQTLLQSYQNVSNSQLKLYTSEFFHRCKRFCKVIKMLAIHNFLLFVYTYLPVANAFAKLSKCQQFTTTLQDGLTAFQLQTLLQSYQNVSNSQLYYYLTNFKHCCKRFCKVIKMLAIHNFCQ